MNRVPREGQVTIQQPTEECLLHTVQSTLCHPPTDDRHPTHLPPYNKCWLLCSQCTPCRQITGNVRPLYNLYKSVCNWFTMYTPQIISIYQSHKQCLLLTVQIVHLFTSLVQGVSVGLCIVPPFLYHLQVTEYHVVSTCLKPSAH